MRATITISLPKGTKQKLDSFVKKEGLNRSDIVREALRQYLFQNEFERLRRIAIPKAQEQGIFTDEDVFKIVS